MLGERVLSVLEKSQASEARRIRQGTAVERQWWPEEKRFFLPDESTAALANSELVLVPLEGEGWKLIGSLYEKEPRWLRPSTLELMSLLFTDWHSLLTEADRETVRLAVTSLGRNQIHQERLLSTEKAGFRAAAPKESAHLAGAAFDVSLRSYYSLINGDWRPVSVWNQKNALFNPRLTAAFKVCSASSADKRLCHVLIEKAAWRGELVDSVLHTCVNPEF